ncbi:MAG: hypothetical protein R3F30_12410 [Planctomycetota bacterium]
MKSFSFLSAVLLLAGTAAAQTSLYFPDNQASGTCNVIPFGSTASSISTWGNQKYQCVIDSASMPTAPQIITDLGFAPCGTGVSYFKTIKIQMGYSASTTLSTTFAANLGKPVTVLDSKEYRWHHTGNAWNRIGLQGQFLYIPSNGHLVVDIEVTGANLESGSGTGFHRSTTLQRVYAVGWATTPPATGSSSIAAQKIQLVMTEADAAIFGQGCKGSNGVPTLALNGTGKLNSSFSVDLAGAPASSAALLLLSGTSSPPLPVDLGVIGAPTCLLCVGLDFAFGFPTDATGASSVKFPIPNDQGLVRAKAWFQWVPVDKQANQLGFTLSNFGRVLIGL